jgi:hypothetical protein
MRFKALSKLVSLVKTKGKTTVVAQVAKAVKIRQSRAVRAD